MRARLASLVGWLTSSPRTPRAGRPSRKPRLEALEDRLTLSATTTGITLSNTALISSGYGTAIGDAYTFANGTRDGATDPDSHWPQPGGKGTAITVTYSYDNLLDGYLGGSLSTSTIKAAIQQALSLWAAVAPINFVEVADSGPPPSLTTDYSAAGKPMIRFGHLHVDGPGNVIGYGFYPGATGLAGDVDLDDSENWTVNPSSGVDLLEVATHEIGHALGLGHETVRTAIMNPYYGGRFHGLGTGFLYQDDINGIHAIYGAGHGSVTPLGSTPPVTAPPSPFQVQGTQLIVTGTSGNDTFTFTAGATSSTVTLNRQSYTVNAALIHTVVFNGNGGTDSAVLSASGSNTASLTPTGGTLTGSNYAVTLNGVRSITVNGHAGDSANLYDSGGTDTFTASPGSARLVGTGYQEVVAGFSRVTAHGSGGHDSALLYGSTGNDVFTASPTSSVLTGPGFSTSAVGFASVTAIGGGADAATLSGGTGTNYFVASPTAATLYGTGYSISLSGFGSVSAHSQGGTDVAYLYGSTGNDTLVGRATSTTLSGAGFANTAFGFRSVTAYSQGGRDTVQMYDAPGTNRYVGSGSTGVMYYTGTTTTFSGFSLVSLYATSGGKDQKSVSGITYTLTTSGPWA
jgi:hypothetical protein